MADDEHLHATQLLTRAARGEALADKDLTSMLYRQLHDLAVGRMRAERRDHTLRPTAFVHERTVEKDWRLARARLCRYLRDGESP